jgi:hypothetical protein
MNSKNYLLLNFIFAGIILAIFFYSAWFSPGSNAYPIKCIHQELLGGPCPTCGLSRGFSALVRGEFALAKQIQSNSLSIFAFFFIQLFLRGLCIVLIKKNAFPLKAISNTDLVISILSFFFFFRYLIFKTLYIFYKMMLTGNVG